MKRTKRRLKKWVRYTLYVLSIIVIGIVLALILKSGIDRFERIAQECDKDRGYTCSYYDVRQYSLGK